MNYKHIFGPINSRRLGVSLGINLFATKTCSLNCVYCECGKTKETTIERREYVPTHEVISEIDDFFSNCKSLPDYITFSGSGEPTLYSGIGAIIAHLKKTYPAQKVALLTNATLFYEKAVRESVLMCDIIIPSVDALSPDIFKKIYGDPHSSLNPIVFKQGLISLRKEYTGLLVVELFIIKGLNDSVGELTLLKDFFTVLQPDKIQINSLDRPAAYDWVKVADRETLLRVKNYFKNFDTQIVLGL